MPIVQQGSINTTALVVPDLYVQIVPPQNLVLNGVPTNVVGVVGTACWGPVGQPVIVGHHGGLCPELRAGHGAQVRHGHAGRDGGAARRTEFPLRQGDRQHRYRRAGGASGNDCDLHRAVYRFARQSGRAGTDDRIEGQHLAFDRLAAWPPAGGLRQYRRHGCGILVGAGRCREPGTRATARPLAVRDRQRRRRHDCTERLHHRARFDDRRLGRRGQCHRNATRRRRHPAALGHVCAPRSRLRHRRAGRCRRSELLDDTGRVRARGGHLHDPHRARPATRSRMPSPSSSRPASTATRPS